MLCALSATLIKVGVDCLLQIPSRKNNPLKVLFVLKGLATYCLNFPGSVSKNRDIYLLHLAD